MNLDIIFGIISDLYSFSCKYTMLTSVSYPETQIIIESLSNFLISIVLFLTPYFSTKSASISKFFAVLVIIFLEHMNHQGH